MSAPPWFVVELFLPPLPYERVSFCCHPTCFPRQIGEARTIVSVAFEYRHGSAANTGCCWATVLAVVSTRRKCHFSFLCSLPAANDAVAADAADVVVVVEDFASTANLLAVVVAVVVVAPAAAILNGQRLGFDRVAWTAKQEQQ